MARDLRRRRARERQDLFVAEGVRTVEELLRSPIEIRGVLVAPRLSETARGRALPPLIHARNIPVLEVGEPELASATDTETPQGILAIGRVPDRRLDDVPQADRLRVLVLDAVQDPGNAGTIIRTAAALGVQATIALPGTVDLWNAKVVRSAMGAHFHHTCFASTWAALDDFRRDRDVALWAADSAGEPADRLSAPLKLALIVGNEGSGLTAAARERAARLVAIPMAGPVASLNVTVAAGIILYELSR